MKPVTLVYRRYGVEGTESHPTQASAAQSACAMVEWNEACPVRIEEGGQTIWRHPGPFKSLQGLKDIAGEPNALTS